MYLTPGGCNRRTPVQDVDLVGHPAIGQSNGTRAKGDRRGSMLREKHSYDFLGDASSSGPAADQAAYLLHLRPDLPRYEFEVGSKVGA